ncbi:MAG: hypothetical protein HQL16_01675 [Candidatus Omnitrophica bacterium]|nr:hypothetical protein [Candidatus Omnitrophota bacterium]
MNPPGQSFFKHIIKDPSSLWLLVSNLLTILLAIWQHWNAGTIFFIYWCQSVIIGLFTVLSILSSILVFSGAPLSSPPNRWSWIAFKICWAAFFVLHYGFFHFCYFQIFEEMFRHAESREVFVGVCIFFLTHLFSWVYHKSWEGKKNVMRFAAFMYQPYVRIIPMHITIILGVGVLMYSQTSFGNTALVSLFLIVKTWMDLQMHLVEERMATSL